MKTFLKQALPAPLIVGLKVAFRYVQHLSNSSFFKLANHVAEVPSAHFLPQIVEKQEIKHGEFFENKLSNIRLTASKLSGLVIRQGSIFSFWHLVGNPSERNRFQKSRIIRNGVVDFEVGGGMCQVSGMVYLAALKAGLKILERHNHSVDIYQEHERISPLGADATVVYGAKDLQFLNNLSGAIQLTFTIVNNNELVLTLSSTLPIIENILHFECHEEGHHRIVHTIGERQGKREELAVSVYKI
ncbi:MAG: VanW family protein [Saprospiraceae bacterium]|nr:VanW family protein [Saprospiraceae bacterium]